MTFYRPRLRWLMAALCVAVILLRVGGVHLHLCLDGSEPPVSYHLADSGIHHDQDPHHPGHPAGDHSDRDRAAAEDLLLKKPGAAVDAALPPFVALLLFLIVLARDARLREDPRRRRGESFARLRPPLRGPPSPA